MILLVVLLAACFLMGGGARADILSLMILRPAAVLLGAVALWSVTREQARNHRHALALAAAVVGLTLVHLVPLPPAIWQALPGRELVTEIDRAAGMEDVWRPLSLVPRASWNAFFALAVPLAALFAGIQLDRRGLQRLVPILIVLGMISGLWGILQAIGGGGPLYLYRITNEGSAVGLFSNRNHQALLLAMLFPVLATFAASSTSSPERHKLRIWLALAAGALLVPLLLVTGSRMGLLAGVAGLAAAALLYRHAPAPARRRGERRSIVNVLLIGLGIVALGAIAVLTSRAEAIQRLLLPDQLDSTRAKSWGPILEMAWKYFPAGSGVGTFEDVFKVDEPAELLSKLYRNHAHNDYLELVMTTGLPGIVLFAAFLLLLGRSAWPLLATRSVSSDVRLGRLGVAMIGLMLLGCITDYPLRVPTFSCLFVIAWLFVDHGYRSLREAAPDRRTAAGANVAVAAPA